MPGAHFDITGDNSNIVSVIQDTSNRMEEFASLMKDLGKAGFDLSKPEEALRSLASAIVENEKVMKDYEEQIKTLQEAQKEAALQGDSASVEWTTEKLGVLSERLQETAIETDKLKAAFNELSQEEQKGEGVMVKLLGGTKNYQEIITNLPGPLRSAVTGLNGMTKAARAFIATPLGAVLAAIILAYKALTTWLNKSSEGQKALAKITGYFSGVLAGLQQIVMNVGKALYNTFTNPKQAIINMGNSIKDYVLNRIQAVGKSLSLLWKGLSLANKGEWKEAGQAFKDSWSTLLDGSVSQKIGDTIKGVNDIGKAESDLNVRRDKLRRDRMAWQKEEGELDKQIAEQRNKLYTGSQADRNAASAKMMDLINKKYDKQIEFAREEYEIKKESNGLTTSSLEQLEEQEALNKRVLELEAQRESSKRMALRVEFSSNAAATRTEEQLRETEEKRKDMYESLADAAAAAEREGVAVTISAMREGFKKEKAELERQQAERMAQLEKNARERIEKVEDFQRAEYKRTHGGSTTGFTVNTGDAMYVQATSVNAAELDNEQKRVEIENAEFERKVLESRNESRREYVLKYGSLKEQELALTESYAEKIKKAEESGEGEYAIKALEKERDAELAALSSKYYAEFGNLEQKYTAMLTEWRQKLENVPAEMRERAEETMHESLAGLVEAFVKEGSDVDLSKWAKEVAGKSISAIEKELTSLTVDAAVSGDLLDGGYSETNAKIEYLRNLLKKLKQEVDSQPVSWERLMPVLKDAVSAFTEVGDAIGGATGEIINAAGGILSASLQVANAVKAISTGASALEKATGILALISAAAKVVSKVISLVKENTEANKAAANAARDYASALREVADAKALANLENAFGTDDLAKFREATRIAKELHDSILYNAQHASWGLSPEQQEWRNSVGLGNMDWKDFALVSDQRSSWQKFIGSDKNISRIALGEFFDEEGNLLGEKLKAWYETYSGGMSDEQKALVDNLLGEWEHYTDAVAQVGNYLSDVFNNVSDSVASKMVDNFIASGNALADMTDLADDFAKSMAVAAVKSMLMQKVFTPKAQEELANLLASGDTEGAIANYNALLEGANALSGDINSFLAGINLSQAGEALAQDSTRGAFQTMSQDTADELNGRFTALQIAGETIAQQSILGVGYLASINNLISAGSATLSEIRSMHILESGYLEDIAKQTKPILTFGEVLEKIEKHTARL